MQSTLSQATERLAESTGGAPLGHWLVVAATSMLLALLIACNRSDPQTDGPSIDSPTATNADSSAVGTPAFEWPSDLSHPRLRLEIETISGAGTIVIELMPELAPITVARMTELAREAYYDGTTFHRVIPGFMIQGGDRNSRDLDPNNDPLGNPDIRLPDEFGDLSFVRGVVGMGNQGRKDSTGAQFFIMHADNTSLDGRYTAIGRVVSGMDVVDMIASVPTDRIGRWGPKDRPLEKVVMAHVAIDAAASVEATKTPAQNPGVGYSSAPSVAR